LCSVCAASPEDLAAVLANFDNRPEVLSLDPLDLGDVWRDILLVGEQTFRPHAAEKLIESIGENIGTLEQQINYAKQEPALSDRSTVAFLEWLQPIYVGGHWVPEMIKFAGGRDVFGEPSRPSFRVTLEDVVAAQPDVLIAAPCGYTVAQAREEYRSIDFPAGWQDIPAVRNGRVYALDANSYFSRPGPRLVIGLEILAKLLHPAIAVSPEAEAAMVPIAAAKHAASV
jgi:iron complex transport system substrate-binding protein